MKRRRALDLFCGAGGASRGIADAGFDVVGVDVNPQPHYRLGGRNASIADKRAAMGIDWMTLDEIVKAVPPAYAHAVASEVPPR